MADEYRTQNRRTEKPICCGVNDVFIWRVVAELGWNADAVQKDIHGQIYARLRDPGQARTILDLVNSRCGLSLGKWITNTLKSTASLRGAGAKNIPAPTSFFSLPSQILGFLSWSSEFESLCGQDMNKWKPDADPDTFARYLTYTYINMGRVQPRYQYI